MGSYGYANRGYTTYNDHVCRPVIIDSEGRKQPIVSYTPSESYVVKRETIVEQVRAPMAEYKNYGVNNDKWRRSSSPVHERDRPYTMVDHYNFNSPPKYEVNNDKWRRPSSPVHERDRPYTTVEHYNYNSPPKYEVNNDKWRRPSSPVHERDRPYAMVDHYNYNSPPKYEVSTDKWRRPSSPVHERERPVNNDKWRRPSSPVYDRPQKVEEFITKVQTEVSQPARIGPLTSAYRRNPANPTGHTDSTTGYGDWNKPSGNAIRDEMLTGPPMVNSGARPRPVPLGWTKPTNGPLTGATNDIGEAVNFLKEAVKSTSITAGTPPTRYTEPMPAFSKKDGYVETIDSSEAKRRYAQPVIKKSESYNGTINSRDAIDKYGGAFVPK